MIITNAAEQLIVLNKRKNIDGRTEKKFLDILRLEANKWLLEVEMILVNQVTIILNIR